MAAAKHNFRGNRSVQHGLNSRPRHCSHVNLPNPTASLNHNEIVSTELPAWSGRFCTAPMRFCRISGNSRPKACEALRFMYRVLGFIGFIGLIGLIGFIGFIGLIGFVGFVGLITGIYGSGGHLSGLITTEAQDAGIRFASFSQHTRRAQVASGLQASMRIHAGGLHTGVRTTLLVLT